ncbi:MAG TPA: hypothetical protein PKL73_10480 [Polyangiaceae bacterium]|nr:MAG: hypothetical protein BWY17_04955 [Deltaproteobacteria bacterium ADurb.Bin207]HNS97366.1 hypothetical protein [Polyangiaceae bacterium]HNZ23276.1 hypothetical protein [Polyangiaceae bacterium]HOD21954.1 hypothetical protein [Polyangiaceae bacterium]HOE51501.1 hypothetical protein [Polyangiaceae bacterium]
MKVSRGKRFWGGVGLAAVGLVVAATSMAPGSLAFSKNNKETQHVTSSVVQAQGPEVVLQVPWGPEKEALGRVDGDESASVGPMSFAIGQDGSVWFLDQSKFRLARFGKNGFEREVGIGSETFQDVEIASDGSFVLLDRLVERAVVVMAPSGNIVERIPVQGEGIEDAGLVTAMWLDASGVWLEHLHTHRVRVLDENLRPCERQVLRGREVAEGRDVLGARDDRGNVSLWIEDRMGGNGRQVVVSAPEEIGRIIWLQSDPYGNIYAAFHLLAFDPDDPARGVVDRNYGLRYDKNLQETGKWLSPWTIRQWEQYREVRVQSDGTVWQMGFEDGGVVVARWRWEA